MIYFAALIYFLVFLVCSIVLGANVYLNGIRTAGCVFVFYIFAYLMFRFVTRKGMYLKSFSEEFTISTGCYLVFNLIGFIVSYLSGIDNVSEMFREFIKSFSVAASLVIAVFNAVIIDVATIEESQKWS